MEGAFWERWGHIGVGSEAVAYFADQYIKLPTQLVVASTDVLAWCYVY